VIDAHYASVYRFLLLLGGDAHLAEDLTQETFAAAWQAVRTFKGRSSIKTWLHRIAYNAFVDARRRQVRDKALVGGLGAPAVQAGSDPLTQIISNESLADLCRGLTGLAAEERAVLILHYVEGQSYRAMAEALDKPSGTVKWLTRKALRRLRQQLNREAQT
jgi:RNA polymerase sigma-70 factor (ECF subfamily)